MGVRCRFEVVSVYSPHQAGRRARLRRQNQGGSVTKGAKIAIGCGIAFAAVVVVVVVALFAGAWWVKGKVGDIAGDFAGREAKITALNEKANANAFIPPADGIIAEPRLVKFLDARRRVFAVYEKHRDDLERRAKKEEASFGDAAKLIGILSEVRLAQAEALADIGMSEPEYRFVAETVYKTAVGAEIDKQTGGKSASEAMKDTSDQFTKEMEKLAEQEDMPEEARAQAREALEKAKAGADEAKEQAAALDVPKANIELFRKHEAEIKKYAMTGLEMLL
jgi:hypothetical protein